MSSEWASVAALIQRVDDLEKALKPLADLAPSYAHHKPEREIFRLHSGAGKITVGDLWRARNLLMVERL